MGQKGNKSCAVLYINCASIISTLTNKVLVRQSVIAARSHCPMRARKNPRRSNKNSKEGGGREVSNLRVYNEQQNGQNNQILYNSKTLQPGFYCSQSLTFEFCFSLTTKMSRNHFPRKEKKTFPFYHLGGKLEKKISSNMG